MTEQLILTADMEAKNVLARMCRDNILKHRRARQAGQLRRKRA